MFRQSSAVLKQEIEAKLASRVPSALSPRARAVPVLLPLRNEAWSDLLGGGLPLGAISEIYGAESSGRTTLALSALSAATAEGSSAAWIDVSDTLDPEIAAVCGVNLERLLWVRCGPGHAEATPQPALPPTRNLTLTNPAHAVPKFVGNGGCGSPHPQSEGKGMAAAIHSLLQAQPRSAAQHGRRARRVIGTPGAPNHPLGSLSQTSPHREEQIPTDRLPARRGDYFVVGKLPAQDKTVIAGQSAAHALRARSRQEEWRALDQAVRSTDLLLQAGGFSLLVLDLGSTPAEKALRIPLATWFRFRAACERSQTALLVLSQRPCAQTCAALLAHMRAGEMTVQGNRVVTGFTYGAEIARDRSASTNVVSIRKQPQAEKAGSWTAQPAWRTPA